MALDKTIHMPRNFPYVSLPDALNRVLDFHAEAGSDLVPKSEAAVLIGYSGLHGTAGQVLTALKMFGLIEETATGDIRITELALTIISGSPAEKSNAIYQAAFGPPLFLQIMEKFEDRQPATDELYRFIDPKISQKKLIGRTVNNYRDTVQMVQNAIAASEDDDEKSPDAVEDAVTDDDEIFQEPGPDTAADETAAPETVTSSEQVTSLRPGVPGHYLAPITAIQINPTISSRVQAVQIINTLSSLLELLPQEVDSS